MPFGLLNDEDGKVHFFLDGDFLEGSGPVGVHPNENTATVWLKAEDLLEIIRRHENYAEKVSCKTARAFRVPHRCGMNHGDPRPFVRRAERLLCLCTVPICLRFKTKMSRAAHFFVFPHIPARKRCG
jgi:hypothetical protein